MSGMEWKRERGSVGRRVLFEYIEEVKNAMFGNGKRSRGIVA